VTGRDAVTTRTQSIFLRWRDASLLPSTAHLLRMDQQNVTMIAQMDINEESSSSVHWPVHIEVRLKSKSNSRFDTIRELVHQHVYSDSHLILPSEITGWENVKTLADNVESIVASETACPYDVLPTSHAELIVHVYQLSEEDVIEEVTSGSGDAPDEEVMAASSCELPSRTLEGLW